MGKIGHAVESAGPANGAGGRGAGLAEGGFTKLPFATQADQQDTIRQQMRELVENQDLSGLAVKIAPAQRRLDGATTGPVQRGRRGRQLAPVEHAGNDGAAALFLGMPTLDEIVHELDPGAGTRGAAEENGRNWPVERRAMVAERHPQSKRQANGGRAGR